MASLAALAFLLAACGGSESEAQRAKDAATALFGKKAAGMVAGPIRCIRTSSPDVFVCSAPMRLSAKIRFDGQASVTCDATGGPCQARIIPLG